MQTILSTAWWWWQPRARTGDAAPQEHDTIGEKTCMIDTHDMHKTDELNSRVSSPKAHALQQQRVANQSVGHAMLHLSAASHPHPAPPHATSHFSCTLAYLHFPVGGFLALFQPRCLSNTRRIPRSLALVCSPSGRRRRRPLPGPHLFLAPRHCRRFSD